MRTAFEDPSKAEFPVRELAKVRRRVEIGRGFVVGSNICRVFFPGVPESGSWIDVK